MSKVILILIAFALTACPHSASPSMPGSNAAETTNKSIASTVATTPLQTIFSECSQKRIVGLGAGINIPQDLCFDNSKPVDTTERSNVKVGNSPQSSQIVGDNIVFAKLPKEVQNMVRLTVPDMDINSVVFDLTIIPTVDEKANGRLVKSYSYGSSSKNKAPGKDLNHHSWLFKRQNKLLKLESAVIDTTK